MISVIVPTYMREQYIQSTINSVISQTYSDWELLIVDDGSTDSTVEICKKAAEKEPRIKVFIGEHNGVSVARNFGLEHATGEYVFFLDSDDLIHPYLFAEMLRIADKEKVTAVSCLLRTVDNEVLAKPEFYEFDLDEKIENCRILEGEPFVRELLQSKQQTGAIGGKLISRQSLNGITFNHTIHKGEDTFFIYEYALAGGSIAICEKLWYFYRFHDSNSSTLIRKNVSDNVFLRANTLMYENEKKRGNKENTRLLKKHIIYNMQQMYESALEQGKEKEALKIEETMFETFVKNEDKVVSLKRWVSFILLTCFYSVHKFIKRLLGKK